MIEFIGWTIIALLLSPIWVPVLIVALGVVAVFLGILAGIFSNFSDQNR